MRSLRPRINHATVVAYLALFVALGGSAYAALSITGADVVNGSLTGADIRNNTIRSADVKGVTGADLGAGAPWTLRSPNGRFSVNVNDTGVTMQGPDSQISLDSAGATIDGTTRVRIRSSGTVSIDGGTIALNGTCAPVADANKVFNHTHQETGGITGPGMGAFPGFARVLAC